MKRKISKKEYLQIIPNGNYDEFINSISEKTLILNFDDYQNFNNIIKIHKLEKKLHSNPNFYNI